MPTLVGFSTFAALPEEQITQKISRRILSGDQEMLVWWSIEAGVHVESHSHANEQIVWMLKGKMEFRLGSEQRVCGPGDVMVIPGVDPSVGGTFHFENLVMPPLPKTCPKMVPAHKGVAFVGKTLLQKNFLVSGEISLAARSHRFFGNTLMRPSVASGTVRISPSKGDRDLPPRFRTIQVYPKDVGMLLRQLQRAVSCILLSSAGPGGLACST
jgi:quercetin dioxygenase-like cupin family protein